MIELVLRTSDVQPTVERIDGPVVRLTVSVEEDLSQALKKCQDDLHAAIEWALLSLYDNERAPSRVFIRDAQGLEMTVMVDPCLTYGSETMVRPKAGHSAEEFLGP